MPPDGTCFTQFREHVPKPSFPEAVRYAIGNESLRNSVQRDRHAGAREPNGICRGVDTLPVHKRTEPIQSVK